MPAAIKAARTTHTLEALRALARSGKDATRNARLSMAPSDLEGVGRAEAGRMVGMDRQAVRDWLYRYNAEGPGGLRNRPGGGTACFLDDAQPAIVPGWMESGPDVERDGVVRWRVRDIRRKIEEAFGAAYAGESVRQLLRREGFRFVSGCSEHPRVVRGRGRRFGPGSGLSRWRGCVRRSGRAGRLARWRCGSRTRPGLARRA